MILDLILTRSLENPATTFAEPDDWLFDSMAGGGRASSGARVSHRSSLSYAAVWRGVNLISRDVAKLPLVVYKRKGDDSREPDRDHPAFPLLKRKPSPRMKAYDLKQTLMLHVLLHGNGYGAIFRAGSVPTEILPLSPLTTKPKLLPDGRLIYVHTVEKTGEEVLIQSADMLHIRGLGWDGVVGYDMITYARETLGLGLAMRKHGSKFFGNHAVPGVVLERPEEAPPLGPTGEGNLIRKFDAMTKGLDEHHKTVVLQEGTKATMLGIDARKSQLKEMREFEIREVANFLGLPPHKVGDPSRTAFASLEQENQSYLDEALDGWLCQIECEASDKLLSEAEKKADTHFIEFNRGAIVRIDHATKVKSLIDETNNGLLTENEARAIQNRPSFGPEGDRRRIPANITYADERGKDKPDDDEPDDPVPPTDPDPPEDDDDAGDDKDARALDRYRRLLVDVTGRMTRRVGEQAVRAAKKPDRFVDWIDGKLIGNRSTIAESLVAPLLVITGLDERECDALAERAAGEILEDWREPLLTAAECRAAELAANVKQLVEHCERVDPDRIACRLLRQHAARTMENA